MIKDIFSGYDTLLDSIRSQKTIVFCGAGISLNSGLPLSKDFVYYVLDKIGVPENESNDIWNSNLPFESFFEILQKGSDLTKLFEMFQLGKPNITHYFLAKLVKARYLKTICTTNFDCHIENAFQSIGLVKDKQFKVLFTDSDFNQIDWNDDVVRIIKLHGSVDDFKGMAITLKQVANKILTKNRNRIISHIFSTGDHEKVIVLGYSCSDLFDISPQIEAIDSKFKKVILVDHIDKGKDIKRIVEIANKSEKTIKNPFIKFINGLRAYYNTDELINELNTDIFDDVIEDIIKIKDSNGKVKKLWIDYVDDWSKQALDQYTEATYKNIVGLLFSVIADYSKAIKYFKEGLDCEIDDIKKGKMLNNLASIYSSQGRYDDALELLLEALAISEVPKLKREHDQVAHLGSIGNVYFQQGDYQKALIYINKAIQIAEKIKNNESLCIWRFSLAAIYRNLGKYEEAIELLNNLLTLVRNEGYLYSEESILALQGNIFENQGVYNKAIEKYFESEKIAINTGNKSGLERQYANLGNICLNLSLLEKSEEYHKKALNISKNNNSKRGMETNLANLGNVYNSTGQHQFAEGNRLHKTIENLKNQGNEKKANEIQEKVEKYFKNAENNFNLVIKKYNECLALSRELKTRQSELIHLSNLGSVYNMLGQLGKEMKDESNAIKYFWKAVEMFNDALKNADEIDAIPEKAGILSNLGNIYFYLDDHKKSINYSKEAVIIGRKLNNKQSLAKSLGNLGNSNIHTENYVDAVTNLEEAKKLFKEIGDIQSELTCYNNLKHIKDLGIKINDEIKPPEVMNTDIKKELDSYVKLGKAYFMLGAFQISINCFENSLKMAQNLNDNDKEKELLIYIKESQTYLN